MRFLDNVSFTGNSRSEYFLNEVWTEDENENPIDVVPSQDHQFPKCHYLKQIIVNEIIRDSWEH